MDNIPKINYQKRFTADKIDDHIWLGDIDSSENDEALDALNITHILTVLDFEPQRSNDDSRVRKHVRAYDFHTVDLIGEFESCYQFIEDAVKNRQNVLIHCHAGMSRSATIACAYLMKKYLLSYDEALERLRSKRACVYPNPGFARQLRLYHSLKYSYTAKNPVHKKSSTSDPIFIEKNYDDVIPMSPNTIEYKCKLCRHVVFTDADLVAHIIGKGQFNIQSRSSAFKAKQNAESKDKEYCQQELFTIQPEWLVDIYDKDINDGDILCPNAKCQAKLGRYSLIGEKCTCAKWVNPAFHFHRSKIDECPVKNKDQIDQLLSKRIPN